MQHHNIYELGLESNPANYTPLSPISYLQRAAFVYPDRVAQIHQDTRYTWAETYERCVRLASGLNAMGIKAGETVSFLCANVPALFEAHFGVPMTGAVLNAVNTRLDAEAIAFILQHAEAKVLFVDKEFSEVASKAIKMMAVKPTVIAVDDPYFDQGELLSEQTYEQLLEQADPEYDWQLPENEWQRSH